MAGDELHVAQILEREEHSRWRVIGWWLTGFLCFGAVIIFIFNIGELQKFVEVARSIRPQWLFLALLIKALSYVSAAGLWHQVLKSSRQHHVSFRSLYTLSIAQLFTEQILPSSGLSGALLVVKGLLNRGVRESIGMGCMLVGMVSYYSAYSVAIFLSLVILYSYNALSPLFITMAAIFCLFAVSIPTLVLWLRHLDIHHHLPTFVKRHAIPRAILKVLAQSPVHLLKSRKLLTKTILLQLSVFFLDAATLLIMLYAIGYSEPYYIVFASFIMAALVGTVLPVPLGLGTFEGTCIAMLHVFGVPVEPALIAVLLLRGLTFWLPMLPGVWLARRELHSRKIA